MATAGFFHPDIPPTEHTVRLDAHEAHHAKGALRLRVGDRIKLLDGAGIIADCVIEAISRDALDASVISRELIPAPARSVHIYCALPKGDRQRNLVDMLTQIGIAEFTPIQCERSVVKPKAINMERLQRIAIEACKQSHNPFLPVLHPPADLKETIERACGAGEICLVADRGGKAIEVPAHGHLNVFIGPEGGFTTAELRLLSEAGAQSVGLGSNILRIETAAILLAGLLMLN